MQTSYGHALPRFDNLILNFDCSIPLHVGYSCWHFYVRFIRKPTHAHSSGRWHQSINIRASDAETTGEKSRVGSTSFVCGRCLDRTRRSFFTIIINLQRRKHQRHRTTRPTVTPHCIRTTARGRRHSNKGIATSSRNWSRWCSGWCWPSLPHIGDKARKQQTRLTRTCVRCDVGSAAAARRRPTADSPHATFRRRRVMRLLSNRGNLGTSTTVGRIVNWRRCRAEVELLTRATVRKARAVVGGSIKCRNSRCFSQLRRRPLK